LREKGKEPRKAGQARLFRLLRRQPEIGMEKKVRGRTIIVGKKVEDGIEARVKESGSVGLFFFEESRSGGKQQGHCVGEEKK